MKFGALHFVNAKTEPSLVAETTYKAIHNFNLENVFVSAINADLADTAVFCDAYGVGMDESANCVIVEASRGEKIWYAACVILATHKADINGTVRRLLGAKKVSFASMERATTLTKMEYGGITPIGLPDDWELIVGEDAAKAAHVVIGSGIRGSKLLVAGSTLSKLPNVTVTDIRKN